MTTKIEVRVRRVYGDREPDDGARVLVDRVWPRGLTKERADLDEWCKAVAPSTSLRTWYGYDPERFEEFDAGTVPSSTSLSAQRCSSTCENSPGTGRSRSSRERPIRRSARRRS